MKRDGARCAEKEEEIETLDETMLNATREQKITETQIPDTSEVRQDKDGEGMEAQKNPDEQRIDTTEKTSDITTCTEDKIHNLLNRYVLVQYDNEPYPGVLDCDEDEVYVRCMHRVGRDIKSVLFIGQKL